MSGVSVSSLYTATQLHRNANTRLSQAKKLPAQDFYTSEELSRLVRVDTRIVGLQWGRQYLLATDTLLTLVYIVAMATHLIAGHVEILQHRSTPVHDSGVVG